MTGIQKEPKYISDARSQVETYKEYLLSEGMSTKTVRRMISQVNSCLKTIEGQQGNILLAFLDAESRRIIIEAHPDASKNSINSRLAVFASFVRWCNGTCPIGFLESSSRTRQRADAAFIRTQYSEEIAHLTEALKEEGRTQESIDNVIGGAGICLLRIIEALGPKSISEIGVEEMIWLDGNLDKGTARRRNCMSCLGRLVSSACGTDPYREFKSRDSMAAYVERMRGQPFGDEILAMAQWMKDHNYRPATIKSRVESLRAFIPRVIDIVGEFRLEDVTMDTFYLLRSRVDDVSERTLCTYMEAFEGLIEFSTGRGVYDGRRMLWNAFDSNRTFITKEQWHTILADAGRMERMAIMLGSLAGMRCTEIVELRINDISDTQITIHGKGHGVQGKVVTKDIVPMLRMELDRYMGYRQMLISRYGDASEGRLIINDRQHLCAPITRGVLSSRLATLSKKTGIKFSSHTFRRFYACTLYSAGVNTEVIKRMMRHECIDTTLRCYIEADPKLMKTAEAALEATLFG